MAGFVNVHEAAARTMKVFKLAASIERLAGTTVGAELRSAAENLTDADWVTLAEVLGVGTPSAETRRLVVLFFAKREQEEAKGDPFAGLPGVSS